MVVVTKNDILKYGIKVGILILFLFIFTKILQPHKEKTQIKISNLISQDKLIKCLEETLPIMKQTVSSAEGSEEEIEKINPLKATLDMQLGMMNNLKPKEEKEQKK